MFIKYYDKRNMSNSIIFPKRKHDGENENDNK